MEHAKEKIQFRLTKKEKEQLKGWASDRGYTVSEYIREKIFGRKITVRYIDQDKGKKGLV